MSEIVATSPQACGPALATGRGTLRNQTPASGPAFASLLQGLSGAEPPADEIAQLPVISTRDPLAADKDADPVATDPGVLAATAWPELMLMQRNLSQAVEPRPVAGSGSPDDAVAAGGVALLPTVTDGTGGVTGSVATPEPKPATLAGTPPARLRRADGSAVSGADAPDALPVADPGPALRGDAKFRPTEAPAAASPVPPAGGRVDPAHARDLPAPDFRQTLRSLPPEVEVAAVQQTDSRGLEQERPQRQDGSAPDDGRGREGAGAGPSADRHAPVDEAVPVAGFLPEDLANAAQNATDGMAYWSANGVHTGEIHLQDGQQEPLSIRVRVSGEEAQVSFAADHAAMREQLASSADQLQALLGESGIRLTDVSVGTSGGQPQPQPQPEPGARARDNPPRGAALEPLVPLRQPAPTRQSNGRVDVFA